MSVLNNFDLNSNFWEVNPQFKIPKIFREFYTKDKSKNKTESSKIMWAIALLVDNSDNNIFRNFTEEDKKMLIQEDFLNLSEFDWNKYKDLIEYYESMNLSKAEKSLRIYEMKLEERNQFIANTKYDLDNAKTLDSIISSTKSIFDLIYKLKDDIEREKQSGKTKGSFTESASESGVV